MEDKWFNSKSALGDTGASDQIAGVVRRFFFPHFPADDITAEDINNKIQGRPIVQFVVERNGSISSAKIVRSVDPALDKEALRVISSMPKWNPGKKNGVPVRVKYTIPVTFKLPNKR